MASVFFLLKHPQAEKRSAGQNFPYNLYGTKPKSALPIPSTTRAPIFYKRNTPQAMTEAQSLPLGVPAFKPLKSVAAATSVQSMIRKANEVPSTSKDALQQYPAPNLSAANFTFIQSQRAQNAGPASANPMVISPQANAFKVPVPAFQALPSFVSRISTGQIVHTDNEFRKPATNNFIAPEQYTTIQRADVSFKD